MDHPNQAFSAPAIAFGRGLDYASIPAPVRHQAVRCLVDLLGVAAAGSTTRMAAHARAVAVSQFGALPGQGARMFFADGTASATGAAMAHSAAMDSYDAHDGHALTKGHAGATVLPVLLAVLDAQRQVVGGQEFLARMVMGYEIGLRAGIALHATAADYHSSGAWAAVAAAAVASRCIGLTPDQWQEALGIAEYHGPRAPMMRCIDYPTMVKDSTAWGAPSGVAAAYLAQQGFTGAPAELLLAEPVDALWSDLGGRWRMLEQYFKPYPVCRWAQPAIQAAMALRTRGALDATQIDTITVQSFEQACRLGSDMPLNTEQAQYNLGYPLACALVRGRVGAAELHESAWSDAGLRDTTARVRLVEDATMSAQFPALRMATVTVQLRDGSSLSETSRITLGDPATPLDDAAVDAKALDALQPRIGQERARALLDRAWSLATEPDSLAALAPALGRA